MPPTLAAEGGRLFFAHTAGRTAFECGGAASSGAASGGGNMQAGAHIHLAIREEHIMLSPGSAKGEGLAAAVTGKSFAGGLLRITAKLRAANGSDAAKGGDTGGGPDGIEISASCQGIDAPFEIGDQVLVNWPPASAVIVDQ
jgi:spermidine/putrescine transport system ATP-binding protein